jgi:hypothetical protein
MRKWWIVLGLSLLLTGCATAEVFETVGDELRQPVMAEVGQISLAVPEGAYVQTMVTGDDDKLYFCDGYTVAVQILTRGDLNRTCAELCGFKKDSLNVLETSVGGQKRYDWIWTAAGEGGDVLGRAAVIDDGKYHYCVSLQADAARAGELEGQWSKLLASFYVS